MLNLNCYVLIDLQLFNSSGKKAKEATFRIALKYEDKVRKAANKLPSVKTC